MAVFKSDKYKGLVVNGAGKFKDGRLEVDGTQAARVRRLVGDDRFGITEEKGAGNPDDQKSDDGDNGADEAFDPNAHNAKQVAEYLDGLDSDDAEAYAAELKRLHEVEQGGQARKGVLKTIEDMPKSE